MDIFSKNASDALPPLWKCNHKVTLDGEWSTAEAVRYGPLYKQMMEQLEATKQYIVDNLCKGFIVQSNAPFASPVLMA